MDNICLEKIWHEDSLIELKITASSDFVTAYQNCYIQSCVLNDISDKICAYVANNEKSCYMEFGHKEGNYTPAFSMKLLAADYSGHVKIEVDIEIDDNITRSHRCCFYVNSELGLIETFGHSLKILIKGEIGEKIVLVK